MKRGIRIIIITALFFGLYFYLNELFFYDIRNRFHKIFDMLGVSHILAYVIVGIPIVMGLFLSHKPSEVLDSIGLNKSIFKGIAFSLMSTLPMFVGFSLAFDFNKDFSMDNLIVSVVCAGFFEELYFRGFLFGQFFRYTILGFISSIFLGAILFGLVHINQANGIEEIIGLFFVTFFGGILFAWLYVEWDYNLWVPILLHMLMNLAWDLFSVSENALGDNLSNILRLATIALAITITILYKRRVKNPLVVTKSTLFINH